MTFFACLDAGTPNPATITYFSGNCTATISLEEVDAEQITFELFLKSSSAPRESSMAIRCSWKRRGTALCDDQCIDLTRSSKRPSAGPGALIRALLKAIGRSEIDLDDDRQLRGALDGAVLTARVLLQPSLVLVMGADIDGIIRPHGYRLQYTPLIVRLLRVLQ